MDYRRILHTGLVVHMLPRVVVVHDIALEAEGRQTDLGPEVEGRHIDLDFEVGIEHRDSEVAVGSDLKTWGFHKLHRTLFHLLPGFDSVGKSSMTSYVRW